MAALHGGRGMKRLCLSCHALIDRGPRCQPCSRARDRARNARRTDEFRFYGSAAWQALSRRVVAGASCCAHCGGVGMKLTADHVVTLRRRPELALDEANVVASCRSCQLRRQYLPGGGRAS